MATLSISEFSCLREATLNLARINVIIGLQGSGKSVTTKLFYFFTEIMTNHSQYAERGDTFEEYKRHVAKQFSIWFPASAWGPGRFNINYSAGDFTVRLLRKRSGHKLTDGVNVTFSDWFTSHYNNALNLFEEIRSTGDSNIESNAAASDAFQRAYKIRSVITERAAKRLGSNFVGSQTFIPAGRAFFTSIGRIVAGFEQAGSLDPLTIKFADRKSVV